MSFEKILEEIEGEYVSLENQLASQDVISDPKRLADVSKRYSDLEEIVKTYRDLKSTREDIVAIKELVHETHDPSEKDSLRADQDLLEEKERELIRKLKTLLVPKDPYDKRRVIMTIRGAEGGEEANLFARVLFDMYLKFFQRRKWKYEILSITPSERNGIDEVTILVTGEDAWRRLKHEAGPHRVQRVPVTEASGRIHTSSATVTVLPEIEEVEVVIDPNDLRVDVFRSTGPGGQSVNTTDSAVRITHIPTGIVVAVQDERSQIQNRARAMQILRSRLYQMEQEKKERELDKTRKDQIKTGGRSEKIRTYNFKENRVTDHRINLTLYKLDKILEGELEEISDALVAYQNAQDLAAQDA